MNVLSIVTSERTYHARNLSDWTQLLSENSQLLKIRCSCTYTMHVSKAFSELVNHKQRMLMHVPFCLRVDRLPVTDDSCTSITLTKGCVPTLRWVIVVVYNISASDQLVACTYKWLTANLFCSAWQNDIKSPNLEGSPTKPNLKVLFKFFYCMLADFNFKQIKLWQWFIRW